MYIIKNAWANIRRNLGRNVLLLAILLALICASAASIIIHTSAKRMIAQYKEQFSAEVIITRNDALLPEDPAQFQAIDKQLLDKLAASKYLKEVTKTMSSAVILEGIKTLNEGNVPKGDSGIEVDNSGLPSEESSSYVSPNAIIFATTNPAISNEFKQGLRKIVEGSMYTKKNEGIISKQLAEANALKVGDTITMKVSSFQASSTSTTQTITITGLYEDLTQDKDPSTLMALTTRSNEIFISYESVEDSLVLADGYATYDVFFTLQDPKQLSELTKDFRSQGLPAYYEVSMNDAMYQKIVGPVEKMANITLTFTLSILVLGGVVLFLLSALTIRERTYEIGVLRAIGMKKHQIMRGFLYESFILTTIALVIGLSGATLLQKPIASSVLATQKESISAPTTSFIEDGLLTSNIELKEIEEIPTALSMEAMLQIIAVSLFLGLLASSISILHITRYEPMKILSERN